MNVKLFRYFFYCFVIVLFSCCFFPKQVNAAELNATFDGRAVFFINDSPYPDGANTGYNSSYSQEQIPIPDASRFPINVTGYFNSYGNGLFYPIKQIGIVNSTFNFRGGVRYEFRFDFKWTYNNNAYINDFVRSYVLWNTTSDDSVSCDSGSTPCSVRWEQVTSGYYAPYYTAVVTYVPQTNKTGVLVDLGSVNNSNQAVFINYAPEAAHLSIARSSITGYLDSTSDDVINNIQDVANEIMENDNRNQQQTNEKLDKIHDDLTDDDISDSEDSAEDLFNNFTVNNHGLSGIITAPLRLLQSLSTSTCSPLSFPLPFVNQNATLPCMKPIYNTYFHDFLVLYQLITTGLIGYWVVVKIYSHVKGMQNPDDDRIEVFDL